MAAKPSSYTAFLPNTLSTLVNSKAFIPFILSSLSSDTVSIAAIAATQHQRHADLLTIPSTASLADALDVFRKYDITAVPLVHEPPAAHKAKTAKAKTNAAISPHSIVGLFSMHDLLRPLIHHPIFDQAPTSLLPQSAATSAAGSSTAASSSAVARLTEDEFRSALSKLEIWSSPVLPYTSCDASNRRSWFLLAKQKVHDAAVALSSGLRHVLVLEGDDIESTAPASVCMLSAGDLARFIYTSLPDDTSESGTLPPPLSALLCSPVKAHVRSHNIVTFTEDDMTLLAFRRLASPSSASRPTSAAASSAAASAPVVSALGAVPIVNRTHMVIDNLSATDLRLLTPATFGDILQPLSLFRRALRGGTPAGSPTAGSPTAAAAARQLSLRPAFAATLDGEQSMGLLLYKVVNLGISRIWIVDSEARPIGVIALSDIFRMIVALKLSE